MTYLLLDEPLMPDLAAVVEVLRARHPGIEIKGAGDPRIPWLWCDGEAILVMLKQFPLPRSARELPSRRARDRWSEAQTAFERHPAHLVVTTFLDSSDKPLSARRITAVVGGIIATTPGCRGVVWDALVAHSAERWLDMSRQAFTPYPKLPFLLWASIRFRRTVPSAPSLSACVPSSAARSISTREDGAPPT